MTMTAGGGNAQSSASASATASSASTLRTTRGRSAMAMSGSTSVSGSTLTGTSSSSPASASAPEVDPCCPLFMDCVEEALSEAQKKQKQDRADAFRAQMNKLEAMAKAGARMTPHDNGSVTFRVTETTTLSTTNSTVTSSAPITSGVGGAHVVTAAAVPANSGLAQQSLTGAQAPTYRLLMDPRTGRILGTLNANGTMGPAPTGMGGVPAPFRAVAPPPGHHMRLSGPASSQQRMLIPSMPGTVASNRGVRAVRNPAVVDLTRATPPGTGVGGGVGGSGGSGGAGNDKLKQFPALSVHPNTQKTASNLKQMRTEIDMKVKALLVQPAAKFTEWLIQQGLVPPEQYDTNTKKKLKLGMYSDSKKFPHSGGYVWIAEGNQKQFTSVFKGSIFEITSHSPTVILKLMYHWSCQTNINNVVQWVKVDHNIINTYYQVFRSICVSSVQEELVNMGGPGKNVEIGVISLGTTSVDGSKREVRVEILGVLDRSTGNFRLRATEPRPGASQIERFTQILQLLPVWVLKGSKIITDFSIDKDRLRSMGYTNVVQCQIASQNRRAPDSNGNVMDYLKKIVPKMFQNSLSLLSTGAIQQFLDELTFRELCGHYPLLCFDSLIQRASNQTAAAMEQGTMMKVRMKTVADTPHADWRITQLMQQTSTDLGFATDYLPPSIRGIADPSLSARGPSPAGSKRPADPDQRIENLIAKKIKVSADLVRLEEYFYATTEGDVEVLQSEFKADMAFKCHLCKKLYMNNVDFMKHLSLHVASDRAAAVDLADLCQCKYCFKDFETPFGMQVHLEEYHWKKGFEFVCRICEEGFKAKNLLIHHMTCTHVRSEMPYACQVCGYRCSFHRDLMDHFQESHDRTDKLQCPRCLKTFSLSSDKGYNSGAAAQFVAHLQQHQDKKVSCKKCCLNFINEQTMKDHVQKDHVSFKGFDNIESYPYMGNDDPIHMPRPDERTARPASRKAGLVKPSQQSAFAAQNLEDLLMYDVENEDVCGECNKRFNSKGHFTAYLCCTKCRYSTCCTKAISLHVGLFHANRTAAFELGTSIILETALHCCCGFTTSSGNKMAKHLGTFGCKSAYPNSETATKARVQLSSASFAPLVNIEEDCRDISSFNPSEEMAKAYMKEDKNKEEKKPIKKAEGPLAFLGLQQRKSVEEKEGKEEEGEKEKDKEESESERAVGSSKVERPESGADDVTKKDKDVTEQAGGEITEQERKSTDKSEDVSSNDEVQCDEKECDEKVQDKLEEDKDSREERSAEGGEDADSNEKEDGEQDGKMKDQEDNIKGGKDENVGGQQEESTTDKNLNMNKEDGKGGDKSAGNEEKQLIEMEEEGQGAEAAESTIKVAHCEEEKGEENKDECKAVGEGSEPTRPESGTLEEVKSPASGSVQDAAQEAMDTD